MQARRRRIIADIGCHCLLGEKRIQTGLVGDLMDEAARGKRVQKVGFEGRHEFFLKLYVGKRPA